MGHKIQIQIWVTFNINTKGALKEVIVVVMWGSYWTQRRKWNFEKKKVERGFKRDSSNYSNGD